MKETVLFVDDEPNILQGLQRLLRPRRHEWEMTFVSSAREAIQLMNKQCFDVVVSDMRMPEMDGADLLEEVKKLCPRSVRIILSGQAEIDTIVKSISSAHQYLSKPCDPVQLEATINRASTLRKIVGNEEIGAFVSQMQAVPAQQTLYDEVKAELESSAPSMEKIAGAITRDIGMSMKVLQLTNSSFFGQTREVTSAWDAVQMLGVEILRRIFSETKIFQRSTGDCLGSLNLADLHQRGLAVGNFTLRISTVEGITPGTAETSFTTGLLCRVGCMVLAEYGKDKYYDVLKLGAECQASIALEQELFGTTHSEIGAYLLSLWGLPNHIVDAASRHHECGCLEDGDFSVLKALQIAEQLASSTTYETGGAAERFEAHADFRAKYAHLTQTACCKSAPGVN